MLEFFNSLADVFTTIVEYIVSLVESIVMALTFMVSAFQMTNYIFTAIPVVMLPVVVAGVAYLLVINILNKGR